MRWFFMGSGVTAAGALIDQEAYHGGWRPLHAWRVPHPTIADLAYGPARGWHVFHRATTLAGLPGTSPAGVHPAGNHP
jgi:hypothetical protein